MRSYREIFNLALLTVSIIVLNGCGPRTQSRIYEPEKIGGFQAWKLDFKYGLITREERLKNTGSSEIRLTDRGQLNHVLELRDDLFFILQDRYKIHMVEDSSNAGIISIHASGAFDRLTVTLENNSGDTLSRLIIINSDMGRTSFARYAARQIARTIQKGMKSWRRAADRPQTFFPDQPEGGSNGG